MLAVPAFRGYAFGVCFSFLINTKLRLISAHGTGSLSVSCEYLALADGPAGFTQDFSCPALLRVPLRFAWLRVRGVRPLWQGVPTFSTHHVSCDLAALQPHACRNTHGLGSSPFARHYLGNHCYFLFLRVLRCFSSPRSPAASAA